MSALASSVSAFGAVVAAPQRRRDQRRPTQAVHVVRGGAPRATTNGSRQESAVGARFVGLRRVSHVARRKAVRAQAVPVRTVAALNPPLGAQEYKTADLNQIVQERDACGVGIIAELNGAASHTVVTKALRALGCMEHRGGCSADNDSGDGAGIMMQVPWKVLAEWAEGAKLEYTQKHTGVAQVFLPNDAKAAEQAQAIFNKTAAAEGFKVVGWRDVPVDLTVVGKFSKATQPIIKQAIVQSEKGLEENDLERGLYLVRKLTETAAAAEMDAAWAADFYVCSLSSRTLVYKGMLRSVVVGQFYLDLQNPLCETAFAIYHRRFSTNTTPKWPLAQPMRTIGHNGEINTLQGNLNWAVGREATMSHPVWQGREQELRPVTNDTISDSGNLDRVVELLVRSDSPLDATMMQLVPEAYRNHPTLEANYPEVSDFYDFYAGQQEAWDGPALLVFSDGRTVGARLDRNGLRPARFWRTSDGFLYVASEVGVFGDVLTNAENVVYKGRLGPGEMVTAELGSGTFRMHEEICKSVAAAKPYRQWLQGVTRLADGVPQAECELTPAEALKWQSAYGYSGEDMELVISSMATDAIEPTYCMGDDTALPVLAASAHNLYDYFKQRFAQVTNPAIDPLREGLVMSLESHLGARGNFLQPDETTLPKLVLKTPVLNDTELLAIQKDNALKTVTIPSRYVATGQPGALQAGLEALCEAAADAARSGAQVLVLTERTDELVADCPAIPTLLAVGAVHHHLIQAGLRLNCSIIADSATAFSTHHVAVLVGYGASAVCPFLGLESVRQYRNAPRTKTLIKNGKLPSLTAEQMQVNFCAAINKGVKKILSKMGISLLSSYNGAQIFEIYGLGADVVNVAFKGSVSRIGGLTLDDLAAETETFWKAGFPEDDLKKLTNFGFYQSRPGMEYHSNNGDLAKLLHKAIGLGGTGANPEAFKAYTEYLSNAPVTTLRDVLEVKSDRKPIALEEVEPLEAILNRFCTGGMSLGAISRETHETIAVAMNRIGGRSNSGEGGEDVLRFSPVQDVGSDGQSPSFAHLNGLENGDVAFSKIKQVASGRFGVTPFFLMNAEQLEIKVSQGAKPGEGGQLPGKKVSPYIATLRASKPGVPLISPPPHHDIYSIEDLAQLIYDLHMINPAAKVSVKLVGEAGIGTVASGVAKAGADIIQVSGHDGGTGASPISSIKHAGGPWEMGLVETHQTLETNGLRDRVVVRADGGFKGGTDVLMAALMGADEYGFGTVAMIASGCIMARICHTNNCPVGVASQREELRARMPGTPGDVVNFFVDVASEVRQSLAQMGYTSMDDIIGRSDLLRQASEPLPKTAALDLSFLVGHVPSTSKSTDRRNQDAHGNGPVLDDELLSNAKLQAAIADEGTIDITTAIVNTDRSVGGRVAGQVAKKYGNHGFAGALNLTFEGSAGQSFGAFNVGGMNVKLVGEANDYVGKSMTGGELVVVPPANSPISSEEAVIMGNTCLYGATGGRLLADGKAGERFAVRNSRAETVVLGAGDHCCEYMTGGTVVVLGNVGRNVGAGMTGGLGYFLDLDGSFLAKVNGEIVKTQRIASEAGEQQLKGLIQALVEKTGSKKGQAVLDDWANMLPKFWQVVPPSESMSPEVVGDQSMVATTA